MEELQNGKRRKFTFLFLILFLVLCIVVTGAVFGVRFLNEKIKEAGLDKPLSVKQSNFPVMDGTYFMQAFAEACNASLTGDSIILAREYVRFHGPEQAKENLLCGDADIILVSENDAKDVVERGRELGVNIVYQPIAKDGMILYCRAENTDWSNVEVNQFMPLYQNSSGEVFSTTFCYWSSSWNAKQNKILSVGNVEANESAISNGTYPFSYNICLAIRDEGTATTPRRVAAWMLSEEGQNMLCELGYINMKGDPIPEGAGANAYTTYATRHETSVESTGKRVIKGSDGYEVKEGSAFNYMIENPVSWIPEKVNNGTIGQISGLADETAQNAINARIQSAYEELSTCDIPEYRGVRRDIPTTSLLVNVNVNTSVLFNYNNVLSLKMEATYEYALPDDDGVINHNSWGYYENTVTLATSDYLNFDLNTGRELSLENVFVDDFEYLNLISQFVISGNISSLFIQTGSFKGIQPNQKFYLKDDTITFVFDQDSPEFILYDYAPTSITIYFSEIYSSLAVMSRYYDPEINIYTVANTNNKVLIPNRDELDVFEDKVTMNKNVEIRQSWKYNSNLSAYGKKCVQNAVATSNDVIKNLNSFGKQAQYQRTAVGKRQDEYLSITITDHRWVEDGQNVTFTAYQCYDLSSLTQVYLDSLFWAGYDYKSVIREALEKEIALRGGLYKIAKYERIALTEDETKYKIDQLMNNLTNFGMDSKQIYLTFPVDLAKESISLNFQFPFSMFGTENITLFH